MERHRDELRDLGLEIETEERVLAPQPEELQRCLYAAGFAVISVGDRTVIQAPGQPWDYSKIFTILNDLMTQSAKADLTVPNWAARLLYLSRCSMESLAGIMFDQALPLPRQGCAVFVDRIREVADDKDEDREILRTAVHELGHALNLVHRFERPVGRADSTSYMNYPSRYLGGGHAEEYWKRFEFTFDADELEFLRHAPRTAIRPGDAAFHSVHYWIDNARGYVPYLPEVKETTLRLTVQPPQAGPVFAFGQPVLLGIMLENVSDRPITFRSDPLDPKTGGVEVLIRRATGERNSSTLADATAFVPAMQACVLEDESTQVTIPPGGVLRNNLNLTFGSGGFAFAEPGMYDLIPLLGLPVGDTEHLVIGPKLRIRVAYPHDPADERDAMVLLRPDVGAWFALGGSDFLAAAEQDLLELSERRRVTNGAGDPVAAGIVRAAGINAGRSVVRFVDGEFRERPSDPGRAADLLGSLNDVALRTFDRHTVEGTANLAGRHREG